MKSEQGEFNENSFNSLAKEKNTFTNSSEIANLNSSQSVLQELSFTCTHPVVKAWTYWLAAEVVIQWRIRSLVEWNFNEIFGEINPNIENHSSLLLDALEQSKTSSKLISSEIDAYFKDLWYRQSSQGFDAKKIQELLPDQIICLDEWYDSDSNSKTTSLKERLQTNALELQVRLNQKLQPYFYLLRCGGTKTASDYLVALSERLHTLSEVYEGQRQEKLHKRDASRRAFYKLYAQLSQRQWFWSQPMEPKTALEAMKKAYKFRLEAQMCDLAYQLINDLKIQVQHHAQIVARADLWLARLQSWLQEQYPLDPIPSSFLKNYLAPEINVSQVQLEIESWACCVLFEWPFLDGKVSIESLGEQIIKKLHPICWQFYVECLQIE